MFSKGLASIQYFIFAKLIRPENDKSIFLKLCKHWKIRNSEMYNLITKQMLRYKWCLKVKRIYFFYSFNPLLVKCLCATLAWNFARHQLLFYYYWIGCSSGTTQVWSGYVMWWGTKVMKLVIYVASYFKYI